MTVPALPRDLRVLPGLQKSGSNAGNSACLVRPVQKTPKKVDIKKMCFFSVKWNSLFDFVTSFLWFCVPSQGPSGPPRPPEKRQQPRMYIKLSGQTSTKDLRSILLLHEFDSKKIFTIIKIIGRPLNLLFLTFDFFSLRASIWTTTFVPKFFLYDPPY